MENEKDLSEIVDISELINDNIRYRTALKLICEPNGIYSRDKVEYLKSVIEYCQDTARGALKMDCNEK